MPSIDPGKCNLCQLCISACSCGAIVLVDNVVLIVETDDCHWCTTCEEVCPTGALSCPFEIVFEDQ